MEIVSTGTTPSTSFIDSLRFLLSPPQHTPSRLPFTYTSHPHLPYSTHLFYPLIIPQNPPLTKTPYAPNGFPPPCASPCIFSLTLTLTSKNLLTHRSKHTLSPLFKSASRYVVSMHFLLQDCTSLSTKKRTIYISWGFSYWGVGMVP